MTVNGPQPPFQDKLQRSSLELILIELRIMSLIMAQRFEFPDNLADLRADPGMLQ